MKKLTIKSSSLDLIDPTCTSTTSFNELYKFSYCAYEILQSEMQLDTLNPCIALMDNHDSLGLRVFELGVNGWKYLLSVDKNSLNKNTFIMAHLVSVKKKLALDLVKAERVRLDHERLTGDSISLKMAYLASASSCNVVNHVNGSVYRLTPSDLVVIEDGNVTRSCKTVNLDNYTLDINEFSINLLTPLSNNNSIFVEDKGNPWVVSDNLTASKKVSLVTKLIGFNELCTNGWHAIAIAPNASFAVRLYSNIVESINMINPSAGESTILLRANPIAEYGDNVTRDNHFVANLKSLESCYYLLVDPEGCPHGASGELSNMFASVTGDDESVMGFYFNVNGRSYPSWNFSFNNFDSMVSYYTEITTENE